MTTDHPQKITFGEMRASGVRDVLVYCAITTAAITSGSAHGWHGSMSFGRSYERAAAHPN